MVVFAALVFFVWLVTGQNLVDLDLVKLLVDANSHNLFFGNDTIKNLGNMVLHVLDKSEFTSFEVNYFLI